MIRTTILAFVLTFTLMGCNSTLTDTAEEPTSETNNSDLSASSENITLVGIGERCGSKVEALCDPDLECEYTPGEPAGICVSKDVDTNITCDKTKEPVCAQKGRQKLGYLNECEARRHKATILNEGFCEASEVVGNCEGTVESLGNCAEELTGFEYQADTGDCAEIVVRGCELSTPFLDKTSCAETCAQ